MTAVEPVEVGTEGMVSEVGRGIGDTLSTQVKCVIESAPLSHIPEPDGTLVIARPSRSQNAHPSVMTGQEVSDPMECCGELEGANAVWVGAVRRPISHRAARGEKYLAKPAFEEIHYSDAGPVGEVLGAAGDEQIMNRHPPGRPERIACGVQSTMVIVRAGHVKRLARRVRKEAASRPS